MVPIRPNPFAPVIWRTTAGATEAMPDDDDFVAKTDDSYMLRVEQTERNSWWWQVYDPNGEVVIDSPWIMSSMQDAFTIAETVYMVLRGSAGTKDH